MIAEELQSDHIIPLKKADLCEAAIGFMREAQLGEMPVVEQGKLVGYLHQHIGKEAYPKTVGQVLNKECPFVMPDTHLFDVAQHMYQLKVSAIAICDDSLNYKGAIALSDILKAYAHDTANSQAGAIVTLQVSPRDYTLTEIARIVESNDFKIIGLFIRTLPNQLLEVNLKFNSTNINPLLHTFERFSYHIKAVHQLSETKGNLDNRYDWLIKYLNT